MTIPYDVVILAGGACKRMYPLTSGSVGCKALLPVANRPMISYSLKNLADAGVRSAIVVAMGDTVAAAINKYLASQAVSVQVAGAGAGSRDPAVDGTATSGAASPSGAPVSPVRCEVVTVPEEAGTADALRHVMGRIKSDTVVVYSADLLSDVPLEAIVATHHVRSSLATVLVGARKQMAEMKPGKAPKGVDYLGLDATQELLLFAASSPEALRDLRIPSAALARYGALTVRSDLLDLHLYVFSRKALALLQAKPGLSSLKLDFLPALCRLQLQLAPSASAAALEDSAASFSDTDTEADHRAAEAGPLHYSEMSHAGPAPRASAGRVGTYLVKPGEFCARINTVQAYGEVNREVASLEVAPRLLGLAPGRHDNFVAPDVKLGNKATIGSACMVAAGVSLGDKTSVKRCVIGEGCRLGSNVKVINSVLLEGATVQDGAQIQNSVVCAGATIQAGASLKDCQVGPGYTVAAQSDHKDEVLAKT